MYIQVHVCVCAKCSIGIEPSSALDVYVLFSDRENDSMTLTFCFTKTIILQSQSNLFELCFMKHCTNGSKMETIKRFESNCTTVLSVHSKE